MLKMTGCFDVCIEWALCRAQQEAARLKKPRQAMKMAHKKMIDLSAERFGWAT